MFIFKIYYKYYLKVYLIIFEFFYIHFPNSGDQLKRKSTAVEKDKVLENVYVIIVISKAAKNCLQTWRI